MNYKVGEKISNELQQRLQAEFDKVRKISVTRYTAEYIKICEKLEERIEAAIENIDPDDWGDIDAAIKEVIINMIEHYKDLTQSIAHFLLQILFMKLA